MVIGCGVNLSYRIGTCVQCNPYYRVYVVSPHTGTNKSTAMKLASEYCSNMGRDWTIISQLESNTSTDVSFTMDFDCVTKVKQ